MAKDWIPRELAPLWTDLNSEVVWLHGRWIIYKQLYRKSEQRIDLLNATAGVFFYVLQWLLLDDMALSIARLTDPPTQSKHENAVLRQFVQHPVIAAVAPLKAVVEQELDRLDALVERFRLLRHKRIAHRDLRYALKVEEAELPGISVEGVEAVLDQVRKVMNMVQSHFGGGETAYESFMMTSDGDALVAWLKRGHAFEDGVVEGKINYDLFYRSKFVGA